MTDEMSLPDELRPLIDRLHQPVAVRPGMAARALRRRRQRRAGSVAAIGGLAVAAVALLAIRQRATADAGVTFALDAPKNRSVMLVGDFTDWRTDQVRLKRESSGTWEVTLKLPPGRYRFAFLVDNSEWRADARAAPAMDAFGRPTSIITVAAQ